MTAKAPEQAEPTQKPAPAAPASNSKPGSDSSAKGNDIKAQEKEQGDKQDAPVKETVTAQTGEEQREMDVQTSGGAEEAKVREVTEISYGDMEPEEDMSLWIILAAILGVGVIGVAVVVFVKMR